jgi:hypothetical protein
MTRILGAALLARLYTIPYTVWGLMGTLLGDRVNKTKRALSAVTVRSRSPCVFGRTCRHRRHFSFFDPFCMSLLDSFEMDSFDGWVDVMASREASRQAESAAKHQLVAY